MKKLFQVSRNLNTVVTVFLFVTAILLSIGKAHAQCVTSPGEIKGKVFEDKNNNGLYDSGESYIPNVMVTIHDASNLLVSFQTTSNVGAYSFTGLVNGADYRLTFDYLPKYVSSFKGNDSGTSVQFAKAPSCNASLGLVVLNANCTSNPQLMTTCFVQGETNGPNKNVETIVNFEHDFSEGSAVGKFATHGETGSVWGLAWKSATGDLFSSSFVKQYAGLTPHGNGAIFRTRITGSTSSTSKFVTMQELGINTGYLTSNNAASGTPVAISDCDYGKFVGRTGLGALIISPAEDFLYTVNLYNKSLVKMPTVNPSTSNVEEITIPNPNCSNGEYAPFALKYYNDKIYIGVTCTEATNKSDLNSMAVVYEFDPNTKTFVNIFSTNYLKGHWSDVPDELYTQHWFTDIDFTDDGNMILAFTDRIGHKYCKIDNNRLDHQFPDILMAWKNNGIWTLENNGSAGSLTGSGVGNSQGPGGGEFFGDEYWLTQPLYHPETSLGSVYVLPGSNSVVSANYDPGTHSYSGGIHRYSTTNGTKLGSKELYTSQITTLFGKATGFGDIIGRCGLPNIQIGNFVWYDNNNNGIQDAGELPVPNLTLNLLNESCQVVNTTTTDLSGNYLFSNVTPSTQYYIALPNTVLSNEFNLVTLNDKNYVFSPSVINKQNVDSDAKILTACNNSVISINTNKTNHTLDIGLTTAGGFDLALKNEITTTGFGRKGDVLDFKITIYNQGGVPAKNIKVANYIPSGFMYVQSNNPAWSLTGTTAMTTLPSLLLPGSSTTVILKLTLMSNDINSLIDIAEIVSATDQNNVTQNDVDSTPDATNGNDNGGIVNTYTDNKVDDNGSVDEDDEDPALPAVVDLALKQVLDADCVSAGDCNTINISVYNQGTVDVSSFGVVNYFGNLLTLGSNNPGWTLESGKLYFQGPQLQVGNSITIPLNVCIKEGLLNGGVLNYGEINEIKVNGSSTTRDYDSNPDDISNNDAGGIHDTSDDNNINGSINVEEDDQDPVYVGVSYIDLALKMTTEKRKVKEGDNVCFTITLFNQGSETIKEVEVVDYVPATLQLADAGWTLTNDIASKKIVFENGFTPGDEYKLDICFKVKNMENVYYIENIAEISGGKNTCNQEIANRDIDSKGDNIKSNDNGGRPETETDNIVNGLPNIDEDDSDPAILINYIVLPTDCACKANATNGTNGQFDQQLKVRGPKGMTWTIDQALNFYSISSPNPPAPLVPFVTGPSGVVLIEIPVNATTSDYILDGIYEDGRLYTVILKSSKDDFVTLQGGGCTYKSVPVAGLASMCSSTSQNYSVPPSALGYSPSVTGGTISSANADSSKITVAWGSTAGSFVVKFVNKNKLACSEPAILNVAIGNPHLALACKSSIQVSLDADCSVDISPSMIVAGELALDAPYVVMLLDDKGKALPNNMVTKDHIGKKITVKLIEGCSGNSCWGQVTVEDKTAPKIICKDTVEVTCFKADAYPGPLAIDNCSDIIKLTVLDSVAKYLTCHPKYNQFVDKKYVAIDKYGNKSSVCKQTIAIKRIQMDSIKFPASIEMPNALTCNGYLKDAKGFPSPITTGSPKIDGVSLYPSFSKACNIGLDYVDRDFGYIGCARKIMRVWTVYEAWCSAGVIKKDTQTIIIADVKKPTFTCPKDLTVSATSGLCEGLVNFPALTGITDDCATTFTVDIKYPGGFIDNANGGSATLPAGFHKITYFVYDECLNSDSCRMTVFVQDKTAPTVICHQSTTVGITSAGEGYLYSANLNDGSYDACGIDSMRVRRMGTIPFSNLVKFGCADVGKEIMVELKVWDLQNNANSCMVSVLVQDKTLPTITCPDDVTISCDVDIDYTKLDKYGVATAYDACGATVTSTYTKDINQCRTGSIQRIFTAKDISNTVQCTSYIYVKRISNDLNIVWPEDFTTMNGCTPADLDPSKLPAKNAKPKFNDGICDLVGASFDDDYYEIDGSGKACYKIVRTWTVIDWCRKDELGYEPATYQQLIKVTNNVDPTMSITMDTLACTDPNSCDEGNVKIKAIGKDDCTPGKSLSWKYQIDFNFNGTFVADVTNIGRGDTINASGIYDVGKHKIIFTFEDRCGNLITKSKDFIVKNCKSPEPVCINGTSISLGQMNINGQLVRMACIPAKSINVSSSHPCGYKLNYSFSANITDTTKCFTCMDIGRKNITLYVTDEFGNFASCSTYIDVQNNDPSAVSITATKLNSTVPVDSICPGETVTLTAVGVGTILWSTGATTRSINVVPASTTTYTVSVTSTDNCTLVANKIIVVNPIPVGLINTSIASNGSTICAGKGIILTATGGGTYKWNTPLQQTTASVNVSPIITTTYIVTVTSAQGCSATASRQIIVNSLPTPLLAAGSNNLCAGGSTTLSVNGLAAGQTYTYAWNTTPVTTTATVNVTPPVGTTTYIVTVTNVNGCTATSSASIVVNAIPIVAISGTTPVCAGTVVKLKATGGTSYLWQAPPPNNRDSIFVTPTAPSSTYTVTVTNAAGCTASGTKQIVVNVLPNAAISGPNATCNGASVTLTASGGTSYLWANGLGTNATINPTPTAPSTTYTVTVTNGNGCSASTSQVVTVNSNPTATISGTTSICQGETTTLTASGGGTYAWNTNPTQTTAAITVSTAGTYTVTVTTGANCTATASVVVTVKPIPTFSVNTPAPICAGASSTLTVTGAPSGSTYIWNTTPTAQTTAAITVSPTATTTYTVTVTNNGCSANTSRTITVNPLPTPTITGNLLICPGESTTLTASGGGTYAWSTSPVQTTAAITVSPTANTTYTVTVTNANNCTATAAVNVVIKPLPTFTVTTSPSPATICAGTNATLTVTGAPAGSTFNWNTTPAQTTAVITVTPTVTTTYSVSVTNNGCSASTTTTVTVIPKPVVAITGNTNICINVPTTLTASGAGTGGTYLWSTTQTTAAITVTPSATTTYTVTVTNSNQCSTTSSATVTVNTNNSPIALCKNITVKLNASGTVSITGAQVNNNSVPGCDNGALSFSVVPSTFFCNDVTVPPSALSVVLTVTSSTGPTSTCTAQVTVLDTIKPTITCPANLTINCANFTGLTGLPIATATDNCPSPTSPVITVQVLSAVNVCNIGSITRTFRATDRSGNTTECSQLITVTPSTDPLTAADIVFPPNVNLTSCTSTQPSATGSPIVNTQNATCTKIKVTFTDVTTGPPCNYSIARTWRVVDSCQLNSNAPTAGIFTSVQTIGVVDNQAPIIAGYADITVNTAVCPVAVNYNMSGVTFTDCSTVTVTNNSPTATNPNSPNPSGNYSAGVTTVIVTATDACGNSSKDTFTITVNLTTMTEFVLCQKIIRNITSSDFVDVNAREIIKEVQGTCNQNEHMFSYSRTVLADSIIRYTCDSIGDHKLFVYHYKNGVLVDSCKTIITILDPSGFCTGNIFRVVGGVTTENFIPVKGVEMGLGENMPKVTTDGNGQYSLPNMTPGDYMLRPIKNDGILEGISTLDLIMIQRHVLGASKIVSPYRLIAADVNNDNKISAADLVELRKVILGTNTKFKNNTSWKTIDAEYKFPDPSNPFNAAYPLYHEFINPAGQMIVDFIGVKIGDVNNSYVASTTSNKTSVSLESENKLHELKENVELNYSIKDVDAIDGIQLTFNIVGLTDVIVESDILHQEDLQYSIEGSKLKISIALDQVLKLPSQPLFKIKGNATAAGFTDELVNLVQGNIANEVYSNLKPIGIRQSWLEKDNEFAVSQNTPNPWNDKTTIKFTVPRDGQAKIILSDIKGSRILNQTINVVKGQNTFNLSNEVIGNETGVFMYELIFEGKSQHGKMIRIK